MSWESLTTSVNLEEKVLSKLKPKLLKDFNGSQLHLLAVETAGGTVAWI